MIPLEGVKGLSVNYQELWIFVFNKLGLHKEWRIARWACRLFLFNCGYGLLMRLVCSLLPRLLNCSISTYIMHHTALQTQKVCWTVQQHVHPLPFTLTKSVNFALPLLREKHFEMASSASSVHQTQNRLRGLVQCVWEPSGAPSCCPFSTFCETCLKNLVENRSCGSFPWPSLSREDSSPTRQCRRVQEQLLHWSSLSGEGEAILQEPPWFQGNRAVPPSVRRQYLSEV